VAGIQRSMTEWIERLFNTLPEGGIFNCHQFTQEAKRSLSVADVDYALNINENG
jgi:hypothetical protein